MKAGIALVALALVGCGPVVGDYPGTADVTIRDCDTGDIVESYRQHGAMLRLRADESGAYIDATCRAYLDGREGRCDRIDGSTVILESVNGAEVTFAGDVPSANIYMHREQSNGVCVDWHYRFEGN